MSRVTTEDKRTGGVLIDRLRVLNLTPKDLMVLVGRECTTIQRWLNGVHAPDRHSQQLLSDYLDRQQSTVFVSAGPRPPRGRKVGAQPNSPPAPPAPPPTKPPAGWMQPVATPPRRKAELVSQERAKQAQGHYRTYWCRAVWMADALRKWEEEDGSYTYDRAGLVDLGDVTGIDLLRDIAKITKMTGDEISRMMVAAPTTVTRWLREGADPSPRLADKVFAWLGAYMERPVETYLAAYIPALSVEPAQPKAEEEAPAPPKAEEEAPAPPKAEEEAGEKQPETMVVARILAVVELLPARLQQETLDFANTIFREHTSKLLRVFAAETRAETRRQEGL